MSAKSVTCRKNCGELFCVRCCKQYSETFVVNSAGPFEMSNFTCTELNANKLKQKTVSFKTQRIGEYKMKPEMSKVRFKRPTSNVLNSM